MESYGNPTDDSESNSNVLNQNSTTNMQSPLSGLEQQLNTLNVSQPISTNTFVNATQPTSTNLQTCSQPVYHQPSNFTSCSLSGFDFLPTPSICEHDNWQASVRSVRERNALLFNNTMMADVFFKVGSQGNMKKIPAHKYVLGGGSSVFYAMLYGGLAQNSSEIEIPDVDPSGFFNLLRYLYTDQVSIEADSVLSTLYAAKKYIVPELAKACVDYLENSLNSSNACILLTQGRLFEEVQLMNRCWDVVDAQTDECFQSDGFTEIDIKTLESILERDSLNTNELNLFEALCRWARSECHRQGLVPSPENQRIVTGKCLYLIRFPAMSLDEFANGPASSNILSLQECHDLFLHFTCNNENAPKLEFNRNRRKGLKELRVHRFQSSAYRSNQWRYRGHCDSIRFSVDKRIFILGYGLYGSSNGAYKYNLKMELIRDKEVEAAKNCSLVCDGFSKTFPVLFDSPVQIEPGVHYTAKVVLEGNELSYFGQEGLAEVECGKVTFQFHCCSNSTNGTGVQGGQIPEIIFHC